MRKVWDSAQILFNSRSMRHYHVNHTLPNGLVLQAAGRYLALAETARSYFPILIPAVAIFPNY